jgi:hypothetical protein
MRWRRAGWERRSPFPFEPDERLYLYSGGLGEIAVDIDYKPAMLQSQFMRQYLLHAECLHKENRGNARIDMPFQFH